MSKTKKVLLAMVALVALSATSVLAFHNSRTRPEDGYALYFADAEAMYVVAEQRVIEPAADQVLEVLLLEALIAGPTTATLRATLPSGTRLLEYSLQDGIALVNFSREVAGVQYGGNHPGGSAAELMTIASVVNTLTELADISAVQFLLEGEVVEDIWGHMDTSQPISRLQDIIAPRGK